MDARILPRFLKRSAANFVNSKFWRSLSTRTLATAVASTGCSIVAPKDIATRAHARSDAWDLGEKITLYASETDFGGRTVPCIRVREK